MPLKPVVVINHLYEPRNKTTGISVYLFSLLVALLERGEFSYVLATNWTAAELPPELRHTDLQVATLNLSGSTPRNILSQTLALRGLMRKYGAALEFNVNPVGGIGGFWPRVITVHDLYFDVNPKQYKAHHLLWWRLFFPLSWRRARRIICVSGQTRADLVRFHPASAAKTVIVHEAASLEPSAPSEALRKPYGLFVANVSPNKGGDILVAAMDWLERQGKSVEVVHVGRDEGDVFKATQARLGTTAGPQPLGKVDRETLKALYAQATFLAFPSTYEGFGLPVLEAHAFGVPVIATDIPVLREVAGAGALYFKPGDEAALGRHMDALVHDPALWGHVHEAALRNAARFSWNGAAAQTEAVFRDALAT